MGIQYESGDTKYLVTPGKLPAQLFHPTHGSTNLTRWG